MTSEIREYVPGRFQWTAEEAQIIMHGAGFEPMEVYPGRAAAKWRCKCLRCGKESTPQLSRVRRGSRCYFCGRRAVSVARRTPEHVAVAEMEAAGLTPLEPYPDAENPWLCRCQKCGQNVEPRLTNIRKGWGGCRYCRQPGGRPRLEPNEAVQAMRSAGLEPLEPYQSSTTKWRCRCLRCGHEVTPLYSNIRLGSGGCPHCAAYQFDRIGPALVYAYHHAGLGAVKVGVTSDFRRRRRLADFRQAGWRQLKVWLYTPGEAALAIERAVLADLRKRCGSTPFLSPDLMPMGGHTEAFDARLVSAEELVKVIDEAAELTRTEPLDPASLGLLDPLPRQNKPRLAAPARSARSLRAEQEFRTRVADLGGTLLESEWLGVSNPHRAICAQGHDCAPRLSCLRKGSGICRACGRRDPATAEAAFRARVAELGGTVLEAEWLGSTERHRVRCPQGHECTPRPADLRDGRNLCRWCTKRTPVRDR
jgi:Zn finger protein HypA/HybF involved in hydrogenase expression